MAKNNKWVWLLAKQIIKIIKKTKNNNAKESNNKNKNKKSYGSLCVENVCGVMERFVEWYDLTCSPTKAIKRFNESCL